MRARNHTVVLETPNIAPMMNFTVCEMFFTDKGRLIYAKNHRAPDQDFANKMAAKLKADFKPDVIYG